MRVNGISLDALADGAVLEAFNREMQKVAANVSDPNTSATAKRSVTIRMEYKPDDDRELVAGTFNVTSKLCDVNGGAFKAVVGYNPVTKTGEAYELRAGMLGQVSIDEIEAMAQDKQDAQNGKVIDINQAK